MLRVAIVEDVESSRNTFEEYVNRFSNDNGIDFSVTKFCNGSDFINAFNRNFDIVLMDIQMPGMDGFQASKLMGEIDNDVVLIFITSVAKYAINGYEVNARDFLLKPLVYPTFEFRFKRALSSIVSKNDGDTLQFKTKDGMVYLLDSEIAYFESVQHDIAIHTTKGCYFTRTPLKEIEKMIDSKSFSRCNNSYLVNLSHISWTYKTNRYVYSDPNSIGSRYDLWSPYVIDIKPANLYTDTYEQIKSVYSQTGSENATKTVIYDVYMETYGPNSN